MNANALLSVGLKTIATTNSGNTNSFDTDLSFVSFGDNNGNVAWTDIAAPDNRIILERVWKVTETGSDSTGLMFTIPDASSTLGVKLPPEQTRVYMFVDADGDFSSGARVYTGTFSGTTALWTITGVDLDDTEFFTLGSNTPPAPG